MMHHPNMHHQPMSGHPPQHMGGHQGMPAHHQMPPHQMHRENRHVTLTRVPLGPGAAGGAMSHGPSLGMGAAMGVPPPQRPPHPIRAMPHHPQAQHHSVPPQQMKPLRRPYAVGGGYGPSGGVMPPPPFAQHPPMQQPPAPQHPPHTVSAPSNTVTSNKPAATPSVTEKAGGDTCSAVATSGAGGGAAAPAAPDSEAAAQGDSEAPRPAAAQANSKEKTPMCLVNELARYNKIKHQYRLTSETGPAHKKVFTVTLRLGDTEEYTAEGSSIKRAQHCAASAALAATNFPPPPPRAPAPHAAAHPHHRHAGSLDHSGAVMPTVELNALAMKLCQPAVYSSVPPVAGAARLVRRGPYRAGPLAPYAAAALLYRVRVAVGGRAWLGEGSTPQAARHDAAARALHDLRPPPDPAHHDPPPCPPADEQGESNSDILNSEVKSPVSLVHELALKRNLPVMFTVKSERGPPHMRVFVTACNVGDMETEGEGNGKKVSKRRAAERMLDEMRRRWPPALLRARPPHDKRRQQPTKKKPRNLIKPEPAEGAGGAAGAGGADNPISRLAVARHAVRARSPQYRVLEERGAARRREFLVQCDAPPHSATGLGPNKKTAKRRAAHNVLLAMEMSAKTEGGAAQNTSCSSDGNTDATKSGADGKRKEGEAGAGAAGGASDVRQPVPGVLMMDYHQRSGQPHQPNGVSETSATGGSGGNTPGAKDQLMYLSQLLGFTVQFSDFPKRNHGEYLSLVSLSTEPPVMCHGGGPSTAHSHEQCSRAALRALALMGLDAPPHNIPAVSATAAKPSVVSNGIAE
ncbi:double-stranded RNA-binding protein Staufen isoform X2 [Anticarsia gemmatalis]|uniref:double-stranded RNA-binding protein Staufen isoform X2 n=1 Tax=Anticarsia gemmatalis TaxID=129554 RepID=UPI003F7752A0